MDRKRFPAGSLFDRLEESDLGVLARESSLRDLEPGDVAVRAGMPADHVLFLICGVLGVYRTHPKHSNQGVLLGLLESPAIFGDAELLTGMPWISSVRAEVRSSCIEIPRKAFLRSIRRSHGMALEFYRDSCARHLVANNTAQAMVLYDVELRLMRLLLDYARCFGVIRGDSAVIRKRISQQDLALALGVDRRTIIRAMKPLEGDGVVSRFRDRIELHDLSSLKKRLPRDLIGLSFRFGDRPRRLTLETSSN